MELEIQAAIYQHGFVANLRKGISPTQEECTVEFEFYHDSELAAIAEIVVIPPMEDPNSLFDYADDIDVDQGIAVGTLIELFERKVEKLCDYGFNIAYIRHMYVYPQWRKRGIGRWFFNNLDDLMDKYCGMSIGAYCIVPRPMTQVKESGWVFTDDPNGKLKEIMVKTIERAGFVTNNSEAYAFCNDVE